MVVNGVCKNCRDNYLCQLSGQWQLDTPEEYNDQEYCPECKKAIVKALAGIKPKFKEIWLTQDNMPEVPQMTCEKLQEIESKQFCRRIFPGLFDPKTGESQHMGQVEYVVPGKEHWEKEEKYVYRYSYWAGHPPSGKQKEAEITVRTERNLKTGQLIPWRNQEGIKLK